jgi:hypothetical protein
MKFFINTSKDATASIATALDNNSRKTFPAIFFGDIIPIEFCFTDGLGGYSEFDGEANLIVKCAVGDIDDATTYAFTDSFTYSGNTYSGTLTLQTEALATALSGKETLGLSFEVEVVRDNGQIITPLQTTCSIRNTLITSTSSAETVSQADGSSTNTDVLILHYPFNELPEPNTVEDASAYNNDATCFNVNLEDGKFSKALHFNGTSSHVNAGNLGDLGEAYTFSAWFKTDVANTTKKRTVLAVTNYTNGNHFPVWIYQEGTELKMHAQYTVTNERNISKPITNSTWHHAAIVRDGTYVKFYFDGAFEVEQYFADWGDYDGKRIEIGSFFETGSATVKHFFEGMIEDVRVYDKALIDSEIAELHTPTTSSENGNGGSNETLPEFVLLTTSNGGIVLKKESETEFLEFDAMYEIYQTTDNTNDSSLGWAWRYSGNTSAEDYYTEGISTQTLVGTMNGGTTVEEYETTPAKVNIDTSAWDYASYPSNLHGDYSYDASSQIYTQDNGNGGQLQRNTSTPNTTFWELVDTNNANYPWDRYNRSEEENQFVLSQPNSSDGNMQNGATITEV